MWLQPSPLLVCVCAASCGPQHSVLTVEKARGTGTGEGEEGGEEGGREAGATGPGLACSPPGALLASLWPVTPTSATASSGPLGWPRWSPHQTVPLPRSQHGQLPYALTSGKRKVLLETGRPGCLVLPACGREKGSR